jgi:hypothetical protein
MTKNVSLDGKVVAEETLDLHQKHIPTVDASDYEHLIRDGEEATEVYFGKITSIDTSYITLLGRDLEGRILFVDVPVDVLPEGEIFEGKYMTCLSVRPKGSSGPDQEEYRVHFEEPLLLNLTKEELERGKKATDEYLRNLISGGE